MQVRCDALLDSWLVSDYIRTGLFKIRTFGSIDGNIGRAVDLGNLNKTCEVIRTGYKAADCREMLHCLSNVKELALWRVSVPFAAVFGLNQ